MLHPDYAERTCTYQGQEHRFHFEHADTSPERLVPPRASVFCDGRFFGYLDNYILHDADGYGGLRWTLRLSRGDLASGATLNEVLRTGLVMEAERRERAVTRG